jgi:hypothetical protein
MDGNHISTSNTANNTNSNTTSDNMDNLALLCRTCDVRFDTPQEKREHAKSEWQ